MDEEVNEKINYFFVVYQSHMKDVVHVKELDFLVYLNFLIFQMKWERSYWRTAYLI